MEGDNPLRGGGALGRRRSGRRPAPAQAAGQATLEIISRTGVHAFAVELATNDAERARGLMFRKELPDGHGMLFDFQREQPVSFWMHNTYISLDMIFIRGDGRILRIAAEHRADVGQADSVRRPGAGGAGGDRRNRRQTRHRAGRSRGRVDIRPRRSLGRLRTGSARLAGRKRSMYPEPPPAGYSAVW